jgi:hypothetical protein
LAQGPNPADALPPVPPERLGAGILLEDDPLQGPFTGAFSANGPVRDAQGSVMLLDQLNYGGFTLIAAAAQVTSMELEAAIGLTDAPEKMIAVRLVAPDAKAHGELTEFGARIKTVIDVSGQILARLNAAGASCELIRPDFVVFGDASDPAHLVKTLITRLENAK